MDLGEFVQLLVRSDVLTFGEHVTKSGRSTPYFLDFARLETGAQVLTLGRWYAARILDVFGRDVDVVFGPAYKGIPIAVATAAALAQDHDLDVAYAFNRKETKDHGEGGVVVGHVPIGGDRVVIVEDVTTAGTSVRDTMPLLTSDPEVDVRGLVVAVDRGERGTGARPALAEIAGEFGLRVTALAHIDEVVEYLKGHRVDGREVLQADDLARISAYRAQWGA